MILRRLTTALRKQDWFTVMIETLIVVFGVFIGLQVNNWNEARKEGSMERQYVVRLHADMQRSADAIRRSNSYLADQVANEVVLLESLRACEIAPEDQQAVTRALASLGKFVFAIVDRDLINQLRASGQFDVISDPAVREAINLVSQESDGQLRVEPQWLEHATPWTGYARRFYYFDSAEQVESGRWETWENLEFQLDRACQDFEFISAVGNTREATRNLYHWNAAVLARVEAAEAALATNIRERGWDSGQ